MLGQLFHYVYALVVLALGVCYVHRLILADKHTGVAYLSSHFPVEGREVKHELIVGALFLGHTAVAEYVAFVFRVVVAHKLLLALAQFGPVGAFHLGGVAGACLLLLHLFVKLALVYGVAVLTAYQLGKVEGEAVSVEKAERLGPVELLEAVGFELVHGSVEQVDALVECAKERVFLFFHYPADELTLCFEFGIGLPHLEDEYRQELVHECFFLPEERICVAHGAAEDAANHVAGLGIARQLPVGDGECHGAKVVGDNPHGHVGLLVASVFLAGEPRNLADYGLEDVRVVVGVLALEGAHKPLKAHTGVYDVHCQLLKRAVCAAVILHEDKVPYLDDLRVVLVHQFAAGHLGLLFGRA